MKVFLALAAIVGFATAILVVKIYMQWLQDILDLLRRFIHSLDPR